MSDQKQDNLKSDADNDIIKDEQPDENNYDYDFISNMAQVAKLHKLMLDQPAFLELCMIIGRKYARILTNFNNASVSNERKIDRIMALIYITDIDGVVTGIVKSLVNDLRSAATSFNDPKIWPL